MRFASRGRAPLAMVVGANALEAVAPQATEQVQPAAQAPQAPTQATQATQSPLAASPATALGGGAALHMVSWNVAGWQTTVDRVRKFKGGLPAFLERHQIDVLCLQEVKLSAKQLADDAVKLGAELSGFDTFWACNDGAGAQRQGLNGVATFVRLSALPVLRADAEPLGETELDREGRCLMTDHGPFVLFNVYVPNTSGGSRLPFKLRFLSALRGAMSRARAGGKAVILAGDMNMKSRAADVHWSFRVLEIPRLAALAAACNPPDRLQGEARAAVEAVVAAWPSIVGALRQKEHKPFETRNSRNGQTFQRWGVFVKTPAGDVVRLGPPLDDESHARGCYQIDGSGVERDGTVVRGPDSQDAAYVLSRPGVMSICDVVECVRRVAGVEIGIKAQKCVSSEFGRLPLSPAVTEWLESLLTTEMVDSFAAFHPHAEERFTCWDQYKNRRYENIGGRIDFIFVDQSFFERHAHKGDELVTHRRAAPDSAEAALLAATLGGLSEPSSFAGGGMPPLDEAEYNAQFRAAPATGMVYTPPQLSDHIAVSLLLRDVPIPAMAADTSGSVAQRDAATKKCQPHRTAKRISDFFTRKPSDVAKVPGPPAKRPTLGAA